MTLRVWPGLLLGGALACGSAPPDDSAEPYTGPPLPWAHVPFGPVDDPSDNPANAAKVELGRLLFYDPVLSTDRAVACATCHSEIWGMSDGLPLSVGVDGEGPTGPGRDGPNRTRRNSPTLWNVAYQPELFWDGRVGSLEAQALQPLLTPEELGRDPDDVAAELQTIGEYDELFAGAFPAESEPVTPANLARALAVFSRTFISDRAAYDRYTAGDVGALSDKTKAGMQLFAEGGCVGCHRPPLFDSQRYVVRRPLNDSDLGRFEVTGAEADRGAFRVPTLRNARDTEPYFHDGSVTTLADAVAAEAKTSAGRGEGRELSAAEIELVTTFIDKALTDRSRDPDRPETVPSGLPVPKDGFRIPR